MAWTCKTCTYAHDAAEASFLQCKVCCSTRVDDDGEDGADDSGSHNDKYGIDGAENDSQPLKVTLKDSRCAKNGNDKTWK